MTFTHLSVLAEEALGLLTPAGGQTVVDATVGHGGHAVRLAEAVGPTGLLIGLDMDPAALSLAGENLSRIATPHRLFHANFAELGDVLAEAGVASVDALLADLGVCSVHLDDPDRGFSFQLPGPLDMRMDPHLETTAADLVNRLPEAELADMIYQLGQERFSRKIARVICKERVARRIETTGELSGLICRALRVDPSSRKSRIHPATRTFQALRIAVNSELESLDRLLAVAPGILAEGGRIAIISFHSLEDRRVKQDFRARADDGVYQILTKKPIQATAQEVSANPRSRSAKLRVAERIAPGSPPPNEP